MTGSPEEALEQQVAQGSIATGWDNKTSQLKARKSSCTNAIYFTFLSTSPVSIGVKFSPSIPVFHPAVQRDQHELKAKHSQCS